MVSIIAGLGSQENAGRDRCVAGTFPFVADGLVMMKTVRTKRAAVDMFSSVRTVGLTLPGVEATTRYDGFPALKVGGMFMAALATHPSAEPNTLVVRADVEAREALLEDAPDIYYLTDYYRKYPLVLARLDRMDRDALHDLLAVSRRLTLAKRPKGGV
jgi:hypothetical protein